MNKYLKLKSFFDIWLRKCLPTQENLTCYPKRIFIFPTAIGALYLLMIGISVLVGISYQNNFILLYSLFLSLFFFFQFSIRTKI